MKNHPPTYQLFENFDEKLLKLFDNFISHGSSLFEKEFSQLSKFVEHTKLDDTSRSDHSLRQTEKEKYLLELLSYKLYDTVNREKFNKCKNTIIIIPDCLSIHEYECQKEEGSYGDVCQSCHPDCQAYEVTELAEKYSAKVLFSKRKLSEQLEYHSKFDGDTSVIGIACILMLANGMRTASELNIPARGVLLNYTGCDHWNDKPFASGFTIDRLKMIFKEKYGY